MRFTRDPRVAGQLEAFPSVLAPVRIRVALSTPSVTKAPRGPASGETQRLALALDVLREPKHLERFWSKVIKLNGVNACWVWLSARNQQGYGQFWVGPAHRHVAAHRISYALAGGVVPDGACVCHHCDNPICVRPEHLFAGTHSDNLRDMVRKGRHPEQVRKVAS